MTKIQANNLDAQHAEIRAEMDEAIRRIIDTNAYIKGPEMKAFEKDFAAYCRVPHAIGMGNGTDAIYLALRALGVGAGDTVLTVPNTFIATTEAISMAGAKIRFVDVEPSTLLMDPKALAYQIDQARRDGERVRAVIPVHLYGQMCQMDEIMTIARKHDLRVIEDSAQAHGAEFAGKRPGQFGDFATFSFYPGKNLGALGDAGAAVCQDPQLAGVVEKLRDHGRLDKYLHELEGMNSRLDTLQAAVLRVKLKHIERWTDARIQVAKAYDKRLQGVSGVTTVACAPNRRHVYHLYVVRVANRDRINKAMNEAGIATGVHYPIPLHKQPAYAAKTFAKVSMPVAERASDEILSLPMDAHLKDQDIDFVVSTLKKHL